MIHPTPTAPAFARAVEPFSARSASPRRAEPRRARSAASRFWLITALVLFGLQLMSGTEVTYAVLVMVFVLFTGLISTYLGGPRNLIALSCLVFAFQHVILSQIVKIWFWEPADAPLSEPIITMAAYNVAMLAIFAAVYVVKLCRLQKRKPVVPVNLEPTTLFWAGVVVTVLCILRYVALARMGVAENGASVTGGIIGPIRQLQFLPAFSVALGTAHILVTTQNKRSFGVLNVIAIAVTFVFGFLGAGRSSMAGALIPYVITCLSFGYRFRWTHYASLLTTIYIAQFILFPYALFARNTVRTADFRDNIANASALLIDVIADPVKYQAPIDKVMAPEVRKFLYFGKPLPTLDRYAVLITTDGIIEATLQKGTTAMDTITPAFESVIPSFLKPDKTQITTSNFLAHRAPGMVSRNDFTTGITIGFVADAFSAYGWAGVFVIPFLVTLFFDVIYSAISGAYFERNVIYSTLAFLVSWLYSEASIQSIFGVLTLQALLLIFTLWFIQNVASFLALKSSRKED